MRTLITNCERQAKALKKKAMEERVGQAVASGKAEAEKAQQAGGSKVLSATDVLSRRDRQLDAETYIPAPVKIRTNSWLSRRFCLPLWTALRQFIQEPIKIS